MIRAAKRLSQVLTHMGIAYVLAYTVTGSAVFSGLAVLVEPVINAVAFFFHEKAWKKIQARPPREGYPASRRDQAAFA